MSVTVSMKLNAIHEMVGISFRLMARLLGTRPETISRWRSGRVDPHPDMLRKVAVLAWLAKELSEFYSPDEAKVWLLSPQRLLGNASPADCLEQGRQDEVIGLIKQLQDGAFV